MIKIITHNSLQNFLAANEELLLAQESFHNLILGLAYGIRDGKVITSGPLYFSIEENGKVIACALRSNVERPFIVTQCPDYGIDQLINVLNDEKINLKAVVGEEKTSTYFKDQWTKLNNLNFKVSIHLGVYQCHKVIMPENLSSKLIQGSKEHSEIIRKYISGFFDDCFPDNKNAKEEVAILLTRHLDNKTVFLLVNEKNEVVSMDVHARSTLNGGTISLVYTPPEYRGQGFGSTVVALTAQKILDDGKKFVTLFTDLTNPTSNSIYQKVGFVKIGQNIHFDFIN
ncbi:MAG: GNAT family N-acetyltransferase [Rhizobacter sp.]|nr:GNAT family N-acetyltransferase [Bacteriovorax sp.]